ncbi:hypothetical protein C2862_11915, partial [Massilia sp. Mn16-1_5]
MVAPVQTDIVANARRARAIAERTLRDAAHWSFPGQRSIWRAPRSCWRQFSARRGGAVPAHDGLVRAQRFERADGFHGLALGARLQPFAEQDQGDHG